MTLQTISQKLNEKRGGESIYSLSKRTGITNPTLAHIFEGRNFEVANLLKVMEALKISLKDLE